jgi:O-antigen/teichoic acid export membrane protein
LLKQFLRDSFIYGFSGVLTRGISVLLVPFYTRVFTPNDYGIIDLIGIAGAVVAALVPMEITQAIARYYPDCKEEGKARVMTSTAFLFTVVMFGMFLIAAVVFADDGVSLLANGRISPDVLRVAALSMVGTGLFYFAQNQLRWMLLPGKHAITSLAYSVITLATTIVFVLVFHSGVVGVFWAQVIGSLTAFLLAFHFGRVSYSWIFRLSYLKELIHYSTPILPSSLGILVLGYADRVTITKYLTLTDLGLFGIGYRVAAGVTLLMAGFQSAITPIVYHRYAEPSAPMELARVFRNFVFLALLIGSAISIFGKEILMLLTTPPYYSASEVIPLLVISAFMSGMHVFAPGIGIAKKSRLISAINLSGALLTVGLNLYLVPRLGIVGGALATSVSASCIFASYTYFSQKFYYVPHDGVRLLGAAGVALVLVSAGLALPLPNLLVGILIKLALLTGCLLALLAFRIIRKDELLHYARTIVRRLR